MIIPYDAHYLPTPTPDYCSGMMPSATWEKRFGKFCFSYYVINGKDIGDDLIGTP